VKKGIAIRKKKIRTRNEKIEKPSGRKRGPVGEIFLKKGGGGIKGGERAIRRGGTKRTGGRR